MVYIFFVFLKWLFKLWYFYFTLWKRHEVGLVHLKTNLVFNLIIFYLATPWPTSSNYQGNSFTQPMLIATLSSSINIYHTLIIPYIIYKYYHSFLLPPVPQVKFSNWWFIFSSQPQKLWVFTHCTNQEQTNKLDFYYGWKNYMWVNGKIQVDPLLWYLDPLRKKNFTASFHG